MNKGYLIPLSLLALVSLGIASCSQLSVGLEIPGEFICTDAIGCVDIASDEPVHIAYALVISGADETIGIDSRNGIEIAMEDKGQILGHDILLTGEDENCKPEGGLTASTKLAANQSIIAVVGTSCSDAARTGVPILSQAGLTIVSPSNTEFDLTQAGNENQYPGYARTAHNDMVQGKAAAEFAYHELGARKVATIHDGSPYADKLQGVFVENFEQMGGTVTSQEMIDPSETDFKPVLNSIASGEPDLIYYPIFIRTGSIVTRQAQEIPGLENTTLMGADGMFSPDMVEGAADAVEGLYVSSPDSTAFSNTYISEFVPKYVERFGIKPINIYHAHAYDAFMLIANAIENVAIQDPDGTLHIPRQALREALYATKDYQGLTGNLSCTPTGDCADAHIAIYQYHLGEFPPEKIWP
jgi:branched-chain amino acid transport system substrate-binding protein